MGDKRLLGAVLGQLGVHELDEVLRTLGKAPGRLKDDKIDQLVRFLMDGEVDFEDLISSFQAFDLEVMCETAKLNPAGPKRQRVDRLAKWFEREFGDEVSEQMSGEDELDGDDEEEEEELDEDDDSEGENGETFRRPGSRAGATEISDIIDELQMLDEAYLKRMIHEIGGTGAQPSPPYPYQAIALDRLERGASLAPPVSGILHYPTGAGKTRVGLEYIARALKGNPRHRFIWATHTKTLLRQSMVRMAEHSSLFPSGTKLSWIDADEAKEGLSEDAHVVFMTRNALTNALAQAGDGRVRHHWSDHLLGGNPLTLIYDECHQLGAEKFQRSLRKFYESLPRKTKGWRVIGLSATPVPMRREAHPLLQEHVFPLRSEAPTTSHGWPFHIVQKVSNDALERQGVLCRINFYIDRSGRFDLPTSLLNDVIGDARLRPPGRDADPEDVHKYALQFNKSVMGSPQVLSFLARRIGEDMENLGKTIVFLPNIEAANRMAQLLYDGFPAARGKVAAVHSRMRDLRVPGQNDIAAEPVLERFRRLGDQPSVLVNVEMLTEGFDDPKIKTVVLARLTLSTNKFWQMIGRGTRGPSAKGTTECNVIDPIKLTRIYDYFAGYQPSFAKGHSVEFEDPSGDREQGDDALSPVVSQMVRPPDPSTSKYRVDPELERLHAQVAAAVHHFLRGEAMSERQALEIATTARVEIVPGAVALAPSSGQFNSDTATAVLLNEVGALERRAGVDLEWYRRRIPPEVNESLLKRYMRALRAIEKLQLWTESAYAEAEMGGEFQAQIQQEASGGPGSAPSSTAPVAEPPHAGLVTPAIPAVMAPQSRPPVPVPAPQVLERPLSDAEMAVMDAGLAMAFADGHIADVEVSGVAEMLRRMFGRANAPALEAAIRAREVPRAIPFDRLSVFLKPEQRQLLVMQMIEIAAADAVVTPEERAMLHACGSHLGVPEAFVEAVVGASLARADVAKVEPVKEEPKREDNVVCGSCGAQTRAVGAFCVSCGTKLR